MKTLIRKTGETRKERNRDFKTTGDVRVVVGRRKGKI